jgi:zinc carboxypeptidase
MRPCVLVAAAVVCVGGGEASAAIDFTNFHTPAQVQTELGNLAAAHPTIAQLVTIGTSVEGRPITALKISDNVSVEEPGEGDVVFVGLHHAREWIAAELALSVAEYVVTHYASDAALQACVDNLEIWIVPVTNPDGYAYSAASSANRYWRKNRRNNGDGTFGVDLNRNYSYQWGFGSGAEGSDNTIEDTYRGPAPFSEPETAALRDFVKGLHNPRAFVSYHSFSELFLRPWSYTTADPPGEPTLGFIAQNSISRIAAVHGHTYSETIWYNSYGDATDYFWSDVRLAGFTPELRPATGGLNGFSPPPTEIIPTIEENLPAALALIGDAGCRTLWIKDHPADTGSEPSATWLGDHWSQAFWISPDIWTVPEILTEGSTVTLNVRVHNAATTAVPAGTVRAYYTDPRVALEFPSPTAVLIGEQTVTLPPGDTTLTFSWTVPTGTNIWGERHWCVGAIVSAANDRPLTTQIERSSNVAARNFQTVAISAAQVLLVAVTNFLDVAAEYRVTVDPKSLPRGWEVAIPPAPPKRHLNQKARLLRVRGNVLEPGETILQPVRVRPPESARDAEVDIHVNAALLPLVPGKRVAAGNGYTFRVRMPSNAR